MERRTQIIAFALIVMALVGIVVFSAGNNQAPRQQNVTSNVSTQEPIENITQANLVSAQELAQHNVSTDCWIAYEGSVFDITAWLPRHPGSSEAIAPYCGTSSEFEAAFKGKHGQSQVDRLLAEGTFKGELSA